MLDKTTKRGSVNLSIRADLLEEAKALEAQLAIPLLAAQPD